MCLISRLKVSSFAGAVVSSWQAGTITLSYGSSLLVGAPDPRPSPVGYKPSGGETTVTDASCSALLAYTLAGVLMSEASTASESSSAFKSPRWHNVRTEELCTVYDVTMHYVYGVNRTGETKLTFKRLLLDQGFAQVQRAAAARVPAQRDRKHEEEGDDYDHGHSRVVAQPANQM